MIHTFGDSHSKFPWESIPNANVNWLGPKLMHSFGRDKLSLLNISGHGIKSGDVAIFSFGEIDCRCHVHKYVQGSSYMKIIDELVLNYMEAISANIEVAPRDIRYCVFNVVPPVSKENHPENIDYPFLGSDQDRATYHMYMNQKLQKECEKSNITFLDVYEKYADNNGFMLPELGDGNVHIGNPIYVEEKLKELGFI